ncbi:MAG: transglutaminase family protein [Gammaproteobacteria bacterium]|nr:transglutaminase family protein [Gammaproteobacteria bacterium]
MAIRVAINHKTEYQYDRLVNLSPHIVRLRPAVHTRTPVHSYSLKILPEEHFINWQQDPYGNFLARLTFPEKTRKFSVEVSLVAEMVVINPFDFFLDEDANHYPFTYDKNLAAQLAPYTTIKANGPLLRKWLAGVDRTRMQTNDFLVSLNQKLQQDIGYNIRMEPGIQKCDETLTLKRGSCRDTAWLLVQILRHLGLASRFVSGYLIQLKADEKSLDGPSGTDQDFTDLHAWVEVYLPGAGWVGLDPTSGLFAGEGHIPLACTPNPMNASPISGASDKAEVEFYFHNEVTRIHEDPRVTLPYSEQQWTEINTLGEQVDKELVENDVRLTMGGEPTFVSIDDMESVQWNTGALGDHKRERAGDLFLRLKQRFAPGGALQYGQGKWYPGEVLPRWALGCFWRADGEPVWHDPKLIAQEKNNEKYGAEDAKRFMQTLCCHLSIDDEVIKTAYEDIYYYLWKEGTLPTNVDVLNNKLEEETERERLRRLFEKGIGEVCGYAIPLKWDAVAKKKGWSSCLWSFRRGEMFLLPGDSPMGYRLPLDSLPWVEKDKRFPDPERCTFEPRGPLGDVYGEVARRYTEFEKAPGNPPGYQEQKIEADTTRAKGSAEDANNAELIHTALCIEPRNGHLYIFLPPVTHLEHYLDLVHSIEKTAAELKIPVFMEGYEPPHDHRLKRFAITPDPGVIEVNIHPAHSWSELLSNTQAVYQEARLARLATEKFMLDGRHTGTGGGNHVTIGGATPADSPMLRRPDVLQSLVTYWQHHPGLSYLFSGLFIGPTSQAPRVDEARDDSLYELEIAFQQMPQGETPSPWIVDRLLRNLLVDVSGNTHRSEFCIDKLYSPNSVTGRLGLVEFRAFEMPPHVQMSMVQVLLLRSLIAKFWKQPYRKKPVYWGTELHDRFMLPHYVWQDIRDVVCDLQATGYPLKLEWLLPFQEFRFPHIGDITQQDIHLEIRTAMEPWHVLGEEVTALGTSRFVDSAVERVQVKVTGVTDERYVVACNCRRVPLRPTGRRGEFVGAVRFKAWQPPSGLHPMMGVHTPLVFDILDTWNEHSIGGCTYYSGHPGGRHEETFPVNANEAESRRIARFRDIGHTAGKFEVPVEETSRDYPYTLDLRKLSPC